MKSNFSFLNDKFPVLASFGALAERYCYSDSNSCLMKLGMIGETVVNLIFSYDRVPFPRENTAIARIHTLLQDGLITRDLSDILHALRKVRNRAAHENYESVTDAKALLQMAHSLCEWFMQTYGDWNYQNQKFVMPEPQQNPLPEETAAEETKEEALLREAENTAAASKQMDLALRKKQAQKAASQRVKSEAETRYLIDEQLRKVGWEANTEQLRYSNGTRPAKGRYLAIAEWPTDSSIGRKGYADYALFVELKLVAIIEAKAIHKDIPSVIDYQCKDYSRHIRHEDAKYQLGTWGEYKVPFTFATNGRPYLKQYDTKSGIWFLDLRLSYNAPKALHGWMSPAGIMELLAEEYGYPYNVIPCKIMGLAAGGYGCQTLCGALAGACLMFGFFCEPKAANELRNQLFDWYRKEPFPTYQPEYKAVTTVAEDITCNSSVNKFMKANNLQMGDDARKARCAALTGEVVVKAIELLNVLYGYEEAAPVVEEAAPELAANEYIGTSSTSRGEMKVKVTMDGDKIANIEILESSETPGIRDAAFDAVPKAIVEKQSAEVDAITNATESSNAIMEAVKDALSQIKK